MPKEPVFLIYNPKYETELHTDVRQEGCGIILMQESLADPQIHPVYFMSRKTTPAEKTYFSYEQEVLAITTVLKKFRIHSGKKVTAIFNSKSPR